MNIIDWALNSEQFADWFSVVLIGLVFWFLGYDASSFHSKIQAPVRLIRLAKLCTKQGQMVDTTVLFSQSLGVLFVSLSFLAWIVPTHQQRVKVFVIGIFIIFFSVSSLIIYINYRR